MGRGRTIVRAPAEETDEVESMGHAAARARTEQLLHLARHLGPAERDAVEGMYERGLSASAIARAAGVDPRRVSRRAKRGLGRVESDEFRFVLAHRETWPGARRRIATRHFLEGASQREIAREMNVSLHRVRNELHAVRTLLGSVREGSAVRWSA